MELRERESKNDISTTNQIEEGAVSNRNGMDITRNLIFDPVPTKNTKTSSLHIVCTKYLEQF